MTGFEAMTECRNVRHFMRTEGGMEDCDWAQHYYVRSQQKIPSDCERQTRHTLLPVPNSHYH